MPKIRFVHYRVLKMLNVPPPTTIHSISLTRQTSILQVRHDNHKVSGESHKSAFPFGKKATEQSKTFIMTIV